ncbi:MAG: gliding motility-associated C-terminal domain-containing protein, partial [Flavobacteriales bacterium]|nr:gliding motility-associated C-terminal domain-containing protein [Flavobacteriales bacterium]
TLCAGDQLVLDATVPGGSYLWQDGSTNATFNVSTAGIYDVTVTANGCSANDAVQVNYIALPAVDLGPDQTLCDGQSTVLDATLPGATYLWQDGSTDPTYNVSTAGTYSVQVQTGSCSASDAITVSFNPAPVVDLGPDVTACTGDPVNLSLSIPGALFLWQDGSTGSSFAPVVSGTYSVTATLNGCSSSDAIDVLFQDPPMVDLGPDVDLCPGSSVALDAANPGASFLWQDGSTGSTLNVSSAGNYSVTVTVGSCSATDDLNVALLIAPQFNLGNDTLLCPGEQVLLDVSIPGASVIWQDGSTGSQFLVDSPGMYSATVTGASGCSSSDAIEIAYASPGSVDLGPDQSVCDGNTVLLDATLPGATYQWSHGPTSATTTITTSGSYSVEVLQGACSVTDTVVVDVLPVPLVDLGPDQQLCDGEQLLLDASWPGAVQTWSTGATTAFITVDQAASYWVSVDLNGCTASDTLTLDILPMPNVDLGPDLALCPGASVLLDATTPGATYLWHDGSTNATLVADAGSMVMVTVDLSGCSASDAVIVSMLNAPVVDLGNDTTLCTGATLTLTAGSSTADLLWSDGSTANVITVDAPGMVWLQAEANGCFSSDTIAVAFVDPGVVDLGNDTTVCDDDGYLLSVNIPGAMLTWQDGSGSNTMPVTASGTYSVTADIDGCATYDEVTITMIGLPLAPLGDDQDLCPGDTLVLIAPGNASSWVWSDGSTGSELLVLQPGTYGITGSIEQCEFADAITITLPPPVLADLGPDLSLCEGESVLLSVDGAWTSVLWNTGSSDPQLRVHAPGTYWVQVDGPCSVATDTLVILEADCGPYVFVPNAFTPDQDGLNDVFLPSIDGTIVEYELLIFDRWGERIFEANDPTIPWDGSYAGVAAPDGVYVWAIRYKAFSRDGVRSDRATGHVSLLR